MEIIGSQDRDNVLIDWKNPSLSFGMDSIDWVLEGSGGDAIEEGDDEDVVELPVLLGSNKA